MLDSFDLASKKLATLDDFISYCEATTESEWQIDTVRNKGNTSNCLFGHLINWYYGKGYKGNIITAWDFFEDAWATTFFVYLVNDGRNPNYPQPTPRQRCIQLLKNLNDGSELTTNQAMERDGAFIFFQQQEAAKLQSNTNLIGDNQ